ncbi:hypothetical protein Kisp01_29070 [Kineosporia sp. NBRC 101677]|uniref:LCP family protein n=1 Tax=Kineosporia sp. NBRC 101677 TaxID=3032197 RepID=UPI0024A3D5CC|nr:LCP family protein [Kineosporia sp. NBRC 101677]GLY15892.1 hypothetical protein Kisp01_29070 [Kineosporia sp. NBRC 101677]
MSTSPDGANSAPASAEEHGLPWVVSWTVIGSLIPGLGLVAAGRRRAGAAVLSVTVAVLAALLVWLLTGDVLRRGLSFALDPQRLLLFAIAVVVTGVLWALLILLTNAQLLRQSGLGRGQKAVSWVVVAVLVVGVGVPAYLATDYSLVQRDLVKTVFDEDESSDKDAADARPDTEAVDPWAGTKRINVLLIGSDAGRNREGVRPDTLIVASIQPSTGNTVLFSLPRNLERVPFKKGTPGAAAWPDGFYCANDACLLNAVWTWALDAEGYAGSKNPGLKATEDAVTGILGLEIDTYAMLNLKGFEEFIDAVGGLTLDVHERLPIGGDSEHPWETIGYIEAGMNQKMDGWHSLWFARSRWSTSDYDRMRRQRCVIAAVTEQADPVTLASNFPAIASALKDNMSTGIPRSQLQAWVELATRVQKAKVTSLAFTDDVIASRSNPDYDLIRRQVRKAIQNSVNPPAAATATAASTPTPSATVTPEGKPKRKKDKKKDEPDPAGAQDVSQVC